MRRLFFGFCLSFCLVIGCSDDDTSTRQDGSIDQKTDPISDLFRSDASSCAEINATECFANIDCASDERCQSLDGEGAVVCCIKGQRGTKQAGEECSGELECESALCIGVSGNTQYCSKDCQTADDCPEGMKDCRYIAYSGSSSNWCFPAE